MSWNVDPRYTAGAPAVVDAARARLLVDQELVAWCSAVSGLHGPAGRAHALRLGLPGIVVEMHDAGRAWHVFDCITGEWFLRPYVGRAARGEHAQPLPVVKRWSPEVCPPSVDQCTHYAGRVRCELPALVQIVAPDGVDCPGARECSPHACAMISEYQEKLGETWTVGRINGGTR